MRSFICIKKLREALWFIWVPFLQKIQAEGRQVYDEKHHTNVFLALQEN